MRIAVEAVGIGNIARFKVPSGVWRLRIPTARHGGNGTSSHSIGAPSCVSHPSPTAPFGFMGDRRRGRSVENALPLSFWSGSAGSRTERQATSSEADPQGKREPTPLLINGSALAGLSTLCPRRRSPVNQVAVGKGWVTPSNDLGRWRVRSFAAPPARSPQDRKHRPFRIRCRRTGNGVPDQRRPEKHRPFQFRGESNGYGYRRHGAGMEHRPIQSGELRFARCVTRVCGRAGRVLATRFHHVLKRTPTEVRNALAYVLLNARQRYGVLKMPFVSASRASWSLVDPTNDHLPVGGQKASPSSRHRSPGRSPRQEGGHACTLTHASIWQRPKR